MAATAGKSMADNWGATFCAFPPARRVSTSSDCQFESRRFDRLPGSCRTEQQYGLLRLMSPITHRKWTSYDLLVETYLLIPVYPVKNKIVCKKNISRSNITLPDTQTWKCRALQSPTVRFHKINIHFQSWWQILLLIFSFCDAMAWRHTSWLSSEAIQATGC